MKQERKAEFATAISIYVSDLDGQLKEGIKQDEIYQKLQTKAKEEPTQSFIKGYSLNENEFLLYKYKLYVPNVPKAS